MMLKPKKLGTNVRQSFSKIEAATEMPNLIEVQKDSYKAFIDEGIAEVFEDFSPITDFSDRFELYFLDHKLLDTPKYCEKECRDRDATYAIPLRVNVRLVNKITGEIINQDVFMGEIPKMTDNGSFIINGAERVVVSQLVRSPGVYNGFEFDKSGKKLYNTTVIPNRGAWLEIEQDNQKVLWVKVDRTRKLQVSILLRALGFESNQQIKDLFGNDDEYIEATLLKDNTKTVKEGLYELYRRLRPGEVPNDEAVKINLKNIFFDARRYDRARVGRYKFNKRLNLAARIVGQTLAADVITEDGEVIASKGDVVTRESALAIRDAGVNEIDVLVDGAKHRIIKASV